jgi:hypothetical protein
LFSSALAVGELAKGVGGRWPRKPASMRLENGESLRRRAWRLLEEVGSLALFAPLVVGNLAHIL